MQNKGHENTRRLKHKRRDRGEPDPVEIPPDLELALKGAGINPIIAVITVLAAKLGPKAQRLLSMLT